MSDIKFNESQILKLEGNTSNVEVLSTIADLLCEKGLVKDTYKKAILDREAVFPTGLFTGGINVAIPHADVEHVNEASICVGILKEPVNFHAMDEPDNIIEIKLVIMLALKEAHGHIDMLTKIINLIQDQETVKTIIESDNVETVYNIIKSKLL
jgi:PTS system galactitol-specific IIA component